MKMAKNIVSLFFLMAVCIGCYSTYHAEGKMFCKNLSIVYKKLSIDQKSEITLYNFYNGYLKIITPPYVSKNEFALVLSNEELCEKLAWITASREAYHLFVVYNNTMIADILLPGYIGMEKRMLYSDNKNIVLKVKKIARKSRPLIIEELR